MHLPLGGRMIVGAVAAAFPDVDFALRPAGTLAYLNWHQGPTHSLLLAPLWAGLLGALLGRIPALGARGQALFLPALLGILIHIAGDWITAYRTMLFWPLTSARYSLDIAFVIDPRVTLPLAAGVLVLHVRRSRTLAALALACAIGYVGFLGLQRERALAAARDLVAQAGLGAARMDALPQPFSPYHWALIVSAEDTRRHAFVRLRERELWWSDSEGTLLRRMASAYRPPAQAAWESYPLPDQGDGDRTHASAAWRSEALAPFRRFAAWPVVWRIESAPAQMCLAYADLRFKLPELAPSFIFRACAEPPWERWRLERVRGAFWID
jgi:inner membrane protein